MIKVNRRVDGLTFDFNLKNINTIAVCIILCVKYTIVLSINIKLFFVFNFDSFLKSCIVTGWYNRCKRIILGYVHFQYI